MCEGICSKKRSQQTQDSLVFERPPSNVLFFCYILEIWDCIMIDNVFSVRMHKGGVSQSEDSGFERSPSFIIS